MVMETDAQPWQFTGRHVAINAAIFRVHLTKRVRRIILLMTANAISNMYTLRHGTDRLVGIVAACAAKLSFRFHKATAT